MKAIWNGKIIAESANTVVVESNHYFPRDSIVGRYFIESSHTSYCPWKGTANYFNVEVDGDLNENGAWYYPVPKEAAENITGRVAFWNGIEVTE